IASVFVNVVIAIIYLGQLGEMRKATKIAGDAATTAANAYNSSNDSFNKTFAQMQAQTEQARRLANESQTSAEAAKSLATETRRQANIADQNLRLTYGANIRVTAVLYRLGPHSESMVAIQFHMGKSFDPSGQ